MSKGLTIETANYIFADSGFVFQKENGVINVISFSGETRHSCGSVTHASKWLANFLLEGYRYNKYSE